MKAARVLDEASGALATSCPVIKLASRTSRRPSGRSRAELKRDIAACAGVGWFADHWILRRRPIVRKPLAPSTSSANSSNHVRMGPSR